MAPKMNRRGALGLGTVAAAGTVLAQSAPAHAATDGAGADQEATVAVTVEQGRDLVRGIYEFNTGLTGGTWNSYVSVAGGDGIPGVAVDDGSDTLVQALSVNKVPVAIAVMDKVDRGLISLDDHVEVTADIIIADGDGMFRFDGAYPSSVTVGHALANLLTISCDTSVRLCGLVAPAAEINEILAAKGFPNTQVEPVANPNRFYLGTSTPREMHDIFAALVRGRLLSAESTRYLLTLLRSPIAFTDGIRLYLSTPERMQIATKAGWLNDDRHEAGIIFDDAGAPILTYSLFAGRPGDADDFGAAHPLVAARALMGKLWYTTVSALSGPERLRSETPAYRPHNGG